MRSVYVYRALAEVWLATLSTSPRIAAFRIFLHSKFGTDLKCTDSVRRFCVGFRRAIVGVTIISSGQAEERGFAARKCRCAE